MSGGDPASARAQAFAAMDGPAAVANAEVLLDALRDEEWRVRREAALALARSPERDAVIGRLLDRVLDDDIEARNAALDALRTLRAAATQQVLARLSTESGPRRRFLVEALLEGVTTECLPTLRALLDDADPNLPPAAIEVVSALREEAAVPVLIEALSHPDPVVRIGALIALQSRSEPAPLEALVPCARDPITVRVALSLMVARPEPEAFDVVLQCSERGDRHALNAAIRACESYGRAGDAGLRARLIRSWSRWSPAVLPLAGDRREQLVVPAVWMLGHAPTASAAEAVLTALSHAQATVRAAAEDALDVLVTHAPLPALSTAAGVSVALHRAVLRAIAASPAAQRDDLLDALARSVGDPIVGVDALAALAAHAPPDRQDLVWRELSAALDRSPEREDLGAVAQTLRSRAVRVPPELADAAFAPTPAGLSVALSLVRAGGSIEPSLVDAALSSTEASELSLGLRLVEALGDRRWASAAEGLLVHPTLRGQAIAAIRACALGRRTLTGWLADSRPAHRLTAVLSLAERSFLPSETAAGILDDPDAEVALAAFHAMAEEVPRDWLMRLMRRGDPMLAQEGLAMITARGRGAALDLQFEALQHPDSAVRSAAVASLDAASQEVRARLYLRLAEERDPEVAMCIERALEVEAGG